jgi:hypothetical protein
MIGTSTTIASSIDNFTAYVSAELRCAGLRSRLVVAEIDAIGTALRGGFIDAETAVAWAADTGIELIAASSAIIPASS